MGLSFGSTSSCRQVDCTPAPVVSKKLPNPDPKNFKIITDEHIGEYNLVVIQYPDCTNYEGKKVLLYTNKDWEKIKKHKSIDPHFCENHPCPVARFAPTEEGLTLVYNFLLKST